MRDQKILFVITKSNWGGAGKYVYDLATSFKEKNYPVSVALGGNGELTQKLNSAGIPIFSIPHLERDINIFKEIFVFFFLLKIFRKENPSVVHLNSSKIGGLGALAACLAGIPHIIFTAHGWAFNENRSLLSCLIIKFLYWITIILSTKTITVSEEMNSQIKSFPFVSSKIKVIHNGIEKFSPYSQEEALKILIEKNKKLEGALRKAQNVIGTIGELHHIKGIRYLIEAAEKIILSGNRIVVIIIGEGEERNNLERLIKQKDLSDEIFLLGHIENAKMYLRAFDLFVLPSLSEGLGYVVLEAGIVEIPVIASSVGGIPEIIENDKNGILIPPKDPLSLMNAIKKLLDDPNLKNHYATNLKEKIDQKFSIEKMLNQTLEIYRK